MGNIRSEQQAARAVEDTEEYLESLRNRYGRIPVYTPGVYRKVAPEIYLDTLPQERQDYLRKLAREAGLEGMRRGKEDSKRRTQGQDAHQDDDEWISKARERVRREMNYRGDY